MLYALISDIHSNLFALEAALKEIEKKGAEVIIVAGDICGKGPHHFEVIKILSNFASFAVKGNSDIKFISSKQKNTLKQKEKTLIDWLSSLPLMRFIDNQILLCHGSPLKTTDYIYPSVTKEGLLRKLGNFDIPRVLAAGHSHIPFIKRVENIFVVNGGSVGKPIDGDPRGSYALFEIDGEKVKGKIFRFNYDVGKFISILKNMNYSKKTILSFKEGLKNGRNS